MGLSEIKKPRREGAVKGERSCGAEPTTIAAIELVAPTVDLKSCELVGFFGAA